MPAGRGPRPDPTPLDVAARLLARTPLSEAALHERLVLKGYQPETAARTVTRCRELGYVSDQRLAADRARSLRARGAGSLKIADDLRARGIPEPVAAVAVDDSRDGESEAVWARRALDGAGVAAGPRAWRLLVSRGFDPDVVESLLDQAD